MRNLALHITEQAKDNTFVDCDINGGAKIEGKGTKMIRTTINNFKKEYPTIWYILLTSLILPFVVSIVSLIIDHHFFR